MERTVETSSSSQSLMGQLCQPNIFEICQVAEPADDNNDVSTPVDPFGFGISPSVNKSKRVSPKYFIMIGSVTVGLLLIGLMVYICHVNPFKKRRRTAQTNPVDDDDITVSMEKDEDDDTSICEA